MSTAVCGWSDGACLRSAPTPPRASGSLGAFDVSSLEKTNRATSSSVWNREQRRRELGLSNGSIGVVCQNKEGRRGYFPEREDLTDYRE